MVPDGKLQVGGQFTSFAGATRNRLARLNANGTLDATFNPGADYYVGAILTQPDDKILVGGAFSMLAGQSLNSLGRLNSNGSLDASFNPGLGTISACCLVLQPDGKILVGGDLGVSSAPAIFFRLNANGTFDDGFAPEVSGADYSSVKAVALQPDGKILVGGNFTTLNGQLHNRLGRFNANGTVDSTFNPGIDGTNYPYPAVYSVALQADGKILVGGDFTSLGGQVRSNIARLNVDGALDITFNPGADGPVRALALQADGKILAGGDFTTLAGLSRNHLARLNNTDPATQNLSYDGSNIVWRRGGTSPEVWRSLFEYSTNGATWINLGAGARIPGGWQRTGISVPANATIRARGFASGGRHNASSYLVESLLAVAQIPPAIVVNDGSFGIHSNQFGFNVRAIPGQAVVIEASTNLMDWVSIQTNVVTTSGLISFTDPESDLFPRRFYRARIYTGSLPAPAIRVDGSAGFQGGEFGFNLNGVAGQTVVIEASTDLASWSGLATNLLGAGPLYWSDPEATNFLARFYRARVWP